MYSFSAVSSSTCAYGNAALNMPVALMKPSLERRCSCLLAHLLFRAHAHCNTTYHQEVGFGIFLVLALDEDTAAAEVFGKWHAEMGIVESTQVLCLGRIARPNLARLDLELGLPQASSLYQDLICLRRMLALLFSCSMQGCACDIRAGDRPSVSRGLRSVGSSGRSIALACSYICSVRCVLRGGGRQSIRRVVSDRGLSRKARGAFLTRSQHVQDAAAMRRFEARKHRCFGYGMQQRCSG